MNEQNCFRFPIKLFLLTLSQRDSRVLSTEETRSLRAKKGKIFSIFFIEEQKDNLPPALVH